MAQELLEVLRGRPLAQGGACRSPQFPGEEQKTAGVGNNVKLALWTRTAQRVLMTIEPDILPMLEAGQGGGIVLDADRKTGTGLWLPAGSATLRTWALAPSWLIKGPQAGGEGALRDDAP